MILGPNIYYDGDNDRNKYTNNSNFRQSHNPL